jgi:TonB family protein
MHNGVHPIFELGLQAMAEQPESMDFNDLARAVLLEIELTADGEIAQVRVGKSSGSEPFDLLAKASVERAAPFGVAPHYLLSDDGRAHVAWEFHRDRRACAMAFALPERFERGVRVPFLRTREEPAASSASPAAPRAP